MKKLLCALLAVFMLLGITACTNPQDNGGDETTTYTIVAPDGAPALSLAYLMNDSSSLGNDVDFKVVNAGTIATYVNNTDASKLGDVVILPVNAAAKLLGKKDTYQMVGVVTHGNLYVVSNKQITSLDGLKGERIGVIGQGNVPDLTFRALLAKNNIEYVQNDNVETGKVAIKYYAEASELLPALRKDVETVGLLPEPAATKLVGMASAYSIKLDVQQLYGGDYPQAVMVVKKSILENDADFVNAVINGIKANDTWVKENTALAVEKINANVVEGVSPSLDASAITSEVVDRCNVYFESAVDAKTDVINYLQGLISVQENSTAIPNDSFFYGV
ncbi:MAG: ABC transporter substrate-binding protein [Clostridiales bacterium]|nr:ABC transporter substrate-binding protein [Clostridiales bacterium]